MKQKEAGLQMVTTASTPRDVIKARADEKHIRLGDLARKIGVSQRTFSSRLADGRWDTYQLNRMMDYIDLRPEDIMFLIENAA